MTDGVVVTTARALVSSRLLGAPAPIVVLRLIRGLFRGGTNLCTLPATAAARWPERTAIIDDDGALSYRELQAKTEALARELVDGGNGPGEAVGVMCRNGRDFATALFAAALVGADVVLVNTEFRTNALADALSAHQVTTMFCDNEFAEQIRAAGPSVRVIEPATVQIQPDAPRPHVVESGRLILLTSGTTGKPKGVPRMPALGQGERTTARRAGCRVATISIAALTGVLVQAPHWGWSADRTMGLFAAFLATGVVFGVRCRTHAVPLIEGAIVRNRLFLAANLANLIFNTAFGIFLLSVTIWCQNVWYYSALKSGFAIAPGPLMVPIVAVLTIPLVRALGVRQVCVIGALIFAGSAIWIVNTETPHPRIRSVSAAYPDTGRFRLCTDRDHTDGYGRGGTPAVARSDRVGSYQCGRQIASNFGVAILVTVIGAQFLSSHLEHQINISWRIVGALALISALACLCLPGRNSTPTPAT